MEKNFDRSMIGVVVTNEKKTVFRNTISVFTAKRDSEISKVVLEVIKKSILYLALINLSSWILRRTKILY